MKNIRYYVLFLLVMVVGCSETKKPENTTVEEKVEPQVTEEAFTFKSDHIPMIKEQLFFFLRDNTMRIDDNVFIKHEDIQASTVGFKYTVVVADKALLNDITEAEDESEYYDDGYISPEEENLTQGDSVVIGGRFEMTDTQREGGKVSEVTIKIVAEYKRSYLQPSSPYGYGERELVTDSEPYERTVTVDLNSSYAFSKNEMYLKARIATLTAQDLTSFSKSELSYLRNEIFARHGHSFKTEKMQQYFGGQSWYKPSFGDATPFLNELEKTNAQFIRSQE